MEMQAIGLVGAAATFFGVWFGHVAVRKVEFKIERLWIAMAAALVIGVSLETWSLLTGSKLLAAAAGILGMTFLWDSLEFWRQQKRVIKGHAPANPDNPRHARILAENQDATTLDLLNRDPVEHPVSPQEAIHLMVEKG